MFCHQCGTQVPSDVQFCPNCGQSLAAAPAASGAAVWTPPVGIHSQTGRWTGEGWRMVKADIGIYVGLALVTVVLNSIVPFIIQGPLTAGLFIVCIKRTLNRPAEFPDLFKGFNYFIPTLVASLVVGLFVCVGTLFCIIPGLVVAAMYKFTYLFIVDKRMDFWPAMEASRAVVKNDYFGFTMFLLALIGINVLGLLCCVVGLLVTIPLSVAAITVAYKEIVGFDPRVAESL
jgi:uncharacterized membrane protein